MSYNASEVSLYDGKPVALYDFSLGETLHWRYCSGDRDLEFQGETYIAMAVSDDGVKQGQASNSDDSFSLKLQTDAALVQLFTGEPPSEIVWLTVWRVHFPELDGIVQWIGTVASVRREDAAGATVLCKTLTTSFQRAGLRLAWERNCPHLLYDKGCRLEAEDWGVNGSVSALTTTTVTVTLAGTPANALDGGFIKWTTADGVIHRRGIQSATGLALTLLGTTESLSVADAVRVYPGCDRTIGGGCTAFDNTDNFGGFPHMPGKSPFDGTPVF